MEDWHLTRRLELIVPTALRLAFVYLSVFYPLPGLSSKVYHTSNAMATIQTSLDYLKWSKVYHVEKPYEILVHLPNLSKKQKAIPRSNLEFEYRTVSVEDIRGYEQNFDLDTHGFTFMRHSTVVENLKDPTSVNQTYVGEMAKVLQRALGSDYHNVQVFCFDIRVRFAPDIHQSTSLNKPYFFFFF